jgi:hypothetical protein
MHASPEEHHGLLEAAKDFGSAGIRHVRARWALVSAEAGEAGRYVAVLAGLGLAAAVSLLVAYLFFAITVGFAIAWLCDVASGVWVLVLLGTALFHVALGLVLALAARRRLGQSLFPATRAEFRKDFA